MNTYVTVYFGTVLVAMFLVPVMSRVAKKYRLVDVPGPRKVHKTVIPRIGGVAFVVPTLALVLPVFFLDNAIGQSFRQMRAELSVLLVAACLTLVVGLIDDLRSVPGYIKLLCVIAASLAVCASGATVRSFSVGNWFEVETGWLAWPLTVFWITTITVCMNFIDGLDGLAAGIAAMLCGTIVLLAYLADQAAMVVLMLALLGSVTGFLFFNFHPAKIFMGDSGSMFLGFVIGASSIVCQTKKPTLVGLALPLLVLGVPIFDTGSAFVRRCMLERPDNTRVLNDLAWILQEHRHRYDDALALANKGLSLAPGNVHLLDTRGTILSNMPDRLTEAKSDFERIVELSSSDVGRKARTLLQLGRVCVKLSDFAEAKQHLSDALEIDQKANVLTPNERSEITGIVQHSGT